MESSFRRYVFSTEPTRDVCNYPGIVGLDFTDKLISGIISCLRRIPEAARFQNLDQTRVNVLNFLRGGLNFDLRTALGRAYGFNKHTSSFLSSQRYKEGEDWVIKDDQYRKLKTPENANIFIGEIVATGSTIDNGFDITYKIAKEKGIPIKDVVIFSIGGDRTEQILLKYHQMFADLFPDYESTIVIYIEGRFHLADEATPVQIKIPGTDLLRYPALITPEFELSQYQRLSVPMERCTIYDGGSRSFDVGHHLEDVIEYWNEQLEYAKHGFTLWDAYTERWPMSEYSDFGIFVWEKQRIWQGVPVKKIASIFKRQRKLWTEGSIERAKGKRSLVDLCEKRLEELARV